MKNMQNIKRHQSQTGGTFVGIIIGLVIGLTIAVVVALVITKTPLPFLNKSNKSEKAPELTASQITDPNNPLYGNKGPAKEAAKDLMPEKATATDTQPVADLPKTPDKTDAKVVAQDANNVTAKSDNPDEKWFYFLQAGAFREQADAESTKAKLALAGFEASISERSSDTGMLYRVRIGPFNQLEAMNRARVKLSDNGMDVAVIRVVK